MAFTSCDKSGCLFAHVAGMNTRVVCLLRSLTVSCAVFVALLVFSNKAWADGCNLYTASSTCTYNGAIYDVAGPHPTGSGVIQSFLRIQQNGAEEGFNTSARPQPNLMTCDGRTCDDKTDLTFTHNLLSTNVPVVTINGVKYREFLLDINEPAATGGAQNYLTLDSVEVYVSNTASLSDHTSTSPGYGTITGATKVYDLDSMTSNSPDNWINLDYNLVGGGSGYGDMVLFVPDSAAFANNQYVYLYSEFGCGNEFKSAFSCGSAKYPSQAGFEEWWVPGANTSFGTPTAVPEPATLILAGTGLLFCARRYRRRR